MENSSAKPVVSNTNRAQVNAKQTNYGVRKVYKKFVPNRNKPKKVKELPKIDKLNKKEIEEKIIYLYNDGKTQSEIGLILKKENGVQSVKKEIGKTILQYLNSKDLTPSIPEDLKYLLKKAVYLIKHNKVNKKDMTSKRGYKLTVSKIRRLARYYKKKGILSSDWNYSEKKAALLVK